MEISASFEEINKYVSERFHQPVTISYAGEKEVKVTYTKHVFLKDLSINVNLRVVEVMPDSVTLSYSGIFGIDQIVQGAMKFLEPTGVYLEDNQCIRINLADIEKARAVVENISLKDIKTTDSGLIVTFSLKVPVPAS